ncbi:T9SS type A sorting domain-containing protein [Flavobacterium sp.]|uniref:T9SS type A sorting domain-containing protein n=1 Tax=Flavobacterium sp. TaxID=239 RepID=UPI0026105B60|nr:T9SS type A sorting domain-containing protein [Flavobacterium sp.]
MCKKIIFLFLLMYQFCTSQTIYYVDASKTDNTENGLTWATAKKDVQNAIDLAVAGDQIWIKAGVYYPNASPNMTASSTVTATSPLTSRDYYIQLKDGVSIYGGFAGTETALSQRNISDNPTYIDGDIGVAGDKTDNCYHLMIYVGNYSTTGVTVDGLLLRNGNATRLAASTDYSEETYIFANGFDNPIPRRIGGGLYVGRGLNNTISNIVFENNECEVFGAALYLYGISGLFCTYNVINCYFVNNSLSASSYGAMYTNGGNVNCYNSVFYNNSCGSNGGDGVALYLTRTKNKLVNCTFANNQSYNGSALSIQSSETTEIYNSIFYGNTRSNPFFAATSGYDFRQFFAGPTPIIKNCSLMHPSANYTAANYTEMDATSSGNVYEQEPHFSNITEIKGADGKYFTADDGLALLTTSPSKNTGSNTLIPTAVTTDITGASRVLATTVDMGAYEIDGVMSLSDTILVQIGNEGDAPNAVASTVTTTQLGQIVPAITGIIPANQSAYQSYIDANPYSFSAPATTVEVQAMVNAVNLTVTTIFYVDIDQPDNSGDGLSWATAKKDLQVILDSYGNNPGPNVNEVWVKAGDYTPTAFVGTSEALRDKSFWVKGNIKIYGGFSGTETGLSQRNIVANPTVLNGVGAYHTMIVTNTNATSYTLIDGVTITGGTANGTTTNPAGSFSFERNFGGGVLCYQTAPVFNHVIFKTNAAEYGGGVFNQTASPKFSNCVFTENTSTSYGGGVENFNNSSPTFTNCIISNNAALRGGGAANNGGAPTYINCTIVKNSATVATSGGAFHNLNASASTYKNCIIWGNSASDFLTEAGSAINVSYSVTQSTISGTANLSANPQLVDINDGNGADDKWLTSDDGFEITPVSNCGSTGDNSAIPSNITVDILNNPRILQITVDRGAYEVDGANASDSALAQIGDEGDAPNTVASEVTTTQLGQIVPVITNIVTANQTAYQAYIDANPDAFSAPATAAEVQAMVNTVNAQVEAEAASTAVLTQIGDEADAPNTVTSTVTVTQLDAILPAITGIVEANEAAYQAYIDANPDAFSAPATAAEVQAMIDDVNAQVAAEAASDAVLTQIGDEADAPNTVTSTVTVTQLGDILPAITGIVEANEAAYQAYIDANPDLFSAPATADEVQTMVNTVNVALSTNNFDIRSIVIYPNPSHAIFNIKTDANAAIELYDATGRKLKSDKIEIGTTPINVSNYSDGVYFLKISNGNNQTKTIRLIKQ